MPQLPKIEWNPIEDPFSNLDLLGIKTNNGHESRIYSDKDLFDTENGEVNLLPGQIEALHQDNLIAITISRRIDPRCMSARYLTITKSTSAYTEANNRVSLKFLLDQSEARIAAIIHEQLHSLEEDYHFKWHRNPETLSQLAEFLFTRGNNRLQHFFILFKNSFNPDCTDPHATAWTLIRELLENSTQLNPDDTLETRYRRILNYKMDMTEEEKIALIQKAIKEAEEAGISLEEQEF